MGVALLCVLLECLAIADPIVWCAIMEPLTVLLPRNWALRKVGIALVLAHTVSQERHRKFAHFKSSQQINMRTSVFKLHATLGGTSLDAETIEEQGFQ